MPIRIRTYRYAPLATILNVFGRIIGYIAIVAGIALLIGAINEGELVTGILPLILLGGGGAGIIALANLLTDKLAAKILINKFLKRPEFAQKLSIENPALYQKLAAASTNA